MKVKVFTGVLNSDTVKGKVKSPCNREGQDVMNYANTTALFDTIFYLTTHLHRKYFSSFVSVVH